MSLRAPATRTAPAPEEYESADRDLYLDARLAAAAGGNPTLLTDLQRLERAGAIRSNGRVVQIHRAFSDVLTAVRQAGQHHEGRSE